MDEIKKLNLRSASDSKLNIDPETIPTLVPKKALALFQDGDEDPYYKIQSIKFPIKANGYNYTGDFFRSFVDKTNKRPIPGSRNGHEMSWGKRDSTDLILVGGRVDGDRKGTVFLKNYIPPSGASGDNAFFIKENKAGMIDFSLVARTRDEVIENSDGTRTYKVLESLGDERNDAVEFGAGAMEQKTNTHEGKEILGEVMDKKEFLDKLTVLKANAEITLPELAKVMGLEAQIVTDVHLNAVKLNAEIIKLTGDDPTSFIKSLIEERKKNTDSVRAALLTENFGPKEFEDTKKANNARVYADKILGDTELTEAKINEIKEDVIYIKLNAERMELHNDANLVGKGEGTETKENTGRSGVSEY